MPEIKKIYEKQHAGMMSKMLGRSSRKHVKKELNEEQ